VTSLRARWLYTAFVWCCATIMIVLQAIGWLAAGVRPWDFSVVVLVLAAGATLEGWLVE
jgi:hypothetical protein